ncbi:hypothetical protein ACOMHN_045371 [Nucella lapillus]
MVARPGSFVMQQSSPLPALCSFLTAVHCWRWKSFVRPRAVGHIVGSALRPSGPTGLWDIVVVSGGLYLQKAWWSSVEGCTSRRPGGRQCIGSTDCSWNSLS